MNIDLDEFRHRLLEATTDSIIKVNSELAGDRIYGVSLRLDPLGSVIAAICQSEGRLEESVSKESIHWKCESANKTEYLRQMMRWSPEGWIYSEDAYGDVNKMLDECYRANPDRYVDDGGSRLVFLSCLTVLAELDVMGVFGVGESRNGVVLNLNVGDQSDEDLFRWSQQINPWDVYARFKSEIGSSHEAYSQLTYLESGQ